MAADTSRSWERTSLTPLTPLTSSIARCSSKADVTIPLNVTMPWAVSSDSWFDPGAQTESGIPDLSDPAWSSLSIHSHQDPGFPAIPEQWGKPQGNTGCASVPVKANMSAQTTEGPIERVGHFLIVCRFTGGKRRVTPPTIIMPGNGGLLH